MASKVTTALTQNDGPDVFIFAHERIGGWVQYDLLATQNTALEGIADLSGLDDNAMKAGQVEGRQYGLPLATKCVALYVRTDLVQTPPTTTQELEQLSAGLKQKGVLGLAVQTDLFYYAAPFFFGFGGTLLDETGRVDFRQPAFSGFVQYLQSLQQKGYIPDEPNGAMVARLFDEGGAAMVMSGPWFMSDIDDDVPYVVAPLPEVSITGRPMRPFVTVELVYVGKPSQDNVTAERFAAYLAGPDGARVRKEMGKQIVPVQNLWTGDDDPRLRAFAAQAERGVVTDPRPEMRDVWEPADVGLKKGVRQGATPEQAAEAAHRRYVSTTKPPPPPRDPGLFIILLIAAAGLLLLVVARGVLRAKTDGTLTGSLRAWLWVAPAMGGTLALVIVPFLFALGLSFFSHRAGDYQFVGFGNFIEILSARSYAVLEPLSFYYALLVTIVWTAANLLLHVGIGLFLAVLLHPKTRKWRGVYRTLLIIPWAVPNYITALIWKSMFHKQLGAINGILTALGFDAVSWFSSFPTAFFANLCANAWLGFPFMMIVALGALQSIPQDLYEAADLDGASKWQQFWRITLPLLRPAMLPAVILGTVWTFNQFNIVYLVSGGEPDNATDILISEAWRWGFARREQYGYAAAYGALIFLLLLAWSALSSRLTADKGAR